MPDVDEPDMGSCCVCEGTSDVRNVLMLHRKAPIAGRGWGCFECGLAMDGAVAVVCDSCFGDGADILTRLRFACAGYPAMDGRVAIVTLSGTHDHDYTKHPEEER